jgi:hypothetical protein
VRGRLHRGTLLLLTAAWVLTSFSREAREEAGPPRGPGPMSRLAEKVATSGEAFQPKKRQKDGDCQIRYRLPDPKCTPGAVIQLDFDSLCHQPTRSRWNVDPAVQKKALADYGYANSHGPDGPRIDHLIPLELGGDNSIENLWPQPSKPPPGFYEKNYVETYLHNRVCTGELALAEAQRRIATDWLSVWLKISRETGDDGQAR